VTGNPTTVEGLKYALAQAELASPQRVEPGPMLEAMVDRQLLAQQAARIRLDLNSTVGHAIEGARSGILGQAYLETRLHWSPEEARQEVKDYYEANPALFAERRVFRVFELAAIAPPDRLHEIRLQALSARRLNEVADWLKARGIPFNAGGATKGSEEISPGLLRTVAAMKDGQIAVIEVNGGASIVQLLQSEPAPVALEGATPVIERILRARHQAEAAASEMKNL